MDVHRLRCFSKMQAQQFETYPTDLFTGFLQDNLPLNVLPNTGATVLKGAVNPNRSVETPTYIENVNGLCFKFSKVYPTGLLYIVHLLSSKFSQTRR